MDCIAGQIQATHFTHHATVQSPTFTLMKDWHLYRRFDATHISSQGRCPREQRAVNGINNWLRADLPSTEESAVKPLDCILASLYLVKFEVDITLSVRIEGDVDNLAIFLGALGTDIVFKFFDPDFAFFPVALSMTIQEYTWKY